MALPQKNFNFAINAMKGFKRKARYYFLSYTLHDFRASITVFFVALPLCLGISLASGATVSSGLIAGVIGGIVVSLISKSELSVSGPAAGLTAICAVAITDLGSIDILFLAISVAGAMQIALGLARLGGFTHFVPSSVIKGMLAAIGIILMSKQIPLLIGYSAPDFWTNQLFNIVTFDHSFQHLGDIYAQASRGSVLLSTSSLLILILWKKTISKHIPFLPASFITVLFGVLLAMALKHFIPSFQVRPDQFVRIPKDIISQIHLTDLRQLSSSAEIWKIAIVICFVASLETLLSITAIDKLDPLNRVTPQNRELIAQGTGNIFSGLLGGLPITAVIVRSSANAEAGARTKLSSISHGVLILLAILLAIPVINLIPYGVLAVILVRTGYNLAKPPMVLAVYRQGREQFLPFIVTLVSILFTDLLIGVLIGFIYSIYFLIKHSYWAGFVLRERMEGHTRFFTLELDLNVSFLNKKRILKTLDDLPEYSIVEINGADTLYIDHDILEIFKDFKTTAHRKHIELRMVNIQDVETIELG